MYIHTCGVLCRNGRVQKSLERSIPSSESSHCWDASAKARRETFVFPVDFILNAEEMKNQKKLSVFETVPSIEIRGLNEAGHGGTCQ